MGWELKIMGRIEKCPDHITAEREKLLRIKEICCHFDFKKRTPAHTDVKITKNKTIKQKQKYNRKLQIIIRFYLLNLSNH